MKKNDIKLLIEKNLEELRKEMVSIQTEIVKLKRELWQKKLKNTSALKVKKDDLARVLTAIRIKKV